MLKVSLNTLKAIEQGVRPTFKVKVYWQDSETYTEDDYLVSVGSLSTSMSGDGYEIANTTVVLKNDQYYFSRKCARELPTNKLVEIFLSIEDQDVIVFRGVVPRESGWALTETELTLNINA